MKVIVEEGGVGVSSAAAGSVFRRGGRAEFCDWGRQIEGWEERGSPPSGGTNETVRTESASIL